LSIKATNCLQKSKVVVQARQVPFEGTCRTQVSQTLLWEALVTAKQYNIFFLCTSCRCLICRCGHDPAGSRSFCVVYELQQPHLLRDASITYNYAFSTHLYAIQLVVLLYRWVLHSCGQTRSYETSLLLDGRTACAPSLTYSISLICMQGLPFCPHSFK
jgi:hypothetical protein